MDIEPTRRAKAFPPCRILAGFLLITSAALRGNAAEPFLTVSSSENIMMFTAEAFKALPHSEVTATDPHLKLEHRYSGVPIRDLLAKVGAPLGDKLRGRALRMAVVFHSKDGYATLFALAEFDEQFSDRTIILADSEDGNPLAPNAGPLRVVAAGDKRAARWVRMVTSIELTGLPEKAH